MSESIQGSPVLITGARGQVGGALQTCRPEHTEVVAVDRAGLDITDRRSVKDAVARIRPALIINAAAYTAVDKAEAEHAEAFRVNRDGAAHLAEAARETGARLIHLSTDFVFDGKKSSPYRPDDGPNPLNVYGASKLAGEQAVMERTEGRALVVRTAWVYSSMGRNFVTTILDLLRERDELRVVADQVGTPTRAAGLATALWRFAAHGEARGVHHWTDAGVASWYDFAVAVRDLAAAGQPAGRWARVVPVAAEDYPTAARRPAYSVLDKSSAWRYTGTGTHWRHALSGSIDELLASPERRLSR